MKAKRQYISYTSSATSIVLKFVKYSNKKASRSGEAYQNIWQLHILVEMFIKQVFQAFFGQWFAYKFIYAKLLHLFNIPCVEGGG